MIDRRVMLAGAGTAALCAWRGAAAADVPSPEALRRLTLKEHAHRRGMSFGAMVTLPMLERSAALRALVAGQTDMVVPGLELKWGMVEKVRGRPDWRDAERIAAFARAHRHALRGHTAFWYRNIPRWTTPLLQRPDAAGLILERVRSTVAAWKGRIVEWDVVNEAIEPRDGLPGGMRRAPFGHATDAGWIAECFHAAREADPAARLCYNDFGLEYDFAWEADRRRAVLALLAELKRRGAPIDGLGLQSHVRDGPPFDARIYRAFLADASAMGLRLRLTEFDVGIRTPSADPAETDRRIADHARAILDVAFDERAMTGMLCWGLVDGDSQARAEARQKGATGIDQRPLPFDDDLRPKPLWDAIARALDGAPAR